ncbi:MAG: AmmeMemoRadiSam system protein B [Betaproteobacteria bacterium]|nr:AmmeMemoRadiSam system protein B [Betaproteobacteria bacterium]
MKQESDRSDQVRPPAVAGMFYPADRESLARDLADMIEEAGSTELAPGFPKMLVVPHAGYIYSGAVAASAYERLRPARAIVKRVVLLGPCHRVPVRGLALPGAAAFDTPLGRVRIDAEAARAIAGLAQVAEAPAAHAMEHSLEVQLPFLQAVLGEFALLPLVAGEAAPGEVAEVLDRLWGGPETVIVISSDLSHYLAYEEARRVDGATAQAILDFDSRVSHQQACGATPLAGALLAAKQRGLRASLLDLRNSGDTAGGRGRVVGYGAFAFEDGTGAYGEAHGNRLLGLARGAIGAALGFGPLPRIPAEPWLGEWRASFVSLALDGALRGCIGSLESRRPLGEDIMANACAAALEDPRFAPLAREEFARTQIEVSLLSATRRILFEDHGDLLRQLKPGEDGIIIDAEGRRATFLPQVWENLREPEQFVAQLRQKAGIPKSLGTSRCKVMRYRALKWSETRPE